MNPAFTRNDLPRDATSPVLGVYCFPWYLFTVRMTDVKKNLFETAGS